jgi:hypothetical protein
LCISVSRALLWSYLSASFSSILFHENYLVLNQSSTNSIIYTQQLIAAHFTNSTPYTNLWTNSRLFAHSSLYSSQQLILSSNLSAYSLSSLFLPTLTCFHKIVRVIVQVMLHSLNCATFVRVIVKCNHLSQALPFI